jgi:hypothetical protein
VLGGVHLSYFHLLLSAMDDLDTDLPPMPVRTLSAQRVSITMNPDGSITKHAPPPPPLVSAPAPETLAQIDEELGIGHATVAAPIHGPDLAGDEPVAPAALAGLPIDTAALADSTVTKDAVDDSRVHNVDEIGGAHLNPRKQIMNDVSKEEVWLLMRRFDKVSRSRRRSALQR